MVFCGGYNEVAALQVVGTVLLDGLCFFTIKPGLHYFIAAVVCCCHSGIRAYARYPNRPFSHIVAKLFKMTSYII